MLKVLDRLEEILIASLIAGATILIFVAVTHRYALDMSAKFHFDALYDALFKVNLSWAQELCIYMFVWMAKFGAAYGVRTGIHVGVDVVINHLPPRWRFISVMFGLLAGAFFTAVIGTLGVHFVYELSKTDQTSPDMEMPMWIVYLAIPCGSYLMSFRFLQVAWGFLRTGELPHHDAAHVEGVTEDAAIAPLTAPVGASR